jgi:glycosidase
MLFKYLLYGCICSVIFLGCQQKDKIPTQKMMSDSTFKMVVYQLPVRLFGNQATFNKQNGTIAENGVGRFNDINDAALASIKNLGASHVWFMGVMEHPTLTDYTSLGIESDHPFVVKGRAGSPYTIKDYFDVDPDLAVDVKNRMAEFEALIFRTHKNGLRAIIDFVPNHVARQYKSDAKPDGVKDFGQDDDVTKPFSPSNNFYYLPGTTFQAPQEHIQRAIALNLPGASVPYKETPAKVTGNDQFTASPGVNEWFESVKLNYGVDKQDNNKTYFNPIPKTWEMMRDILIFWAKKRVDGFRCDMAEMVPVEFWNWVIPQVKAVNPEIVFIAEIYNPTQYQNYTSPDGFDFLYDKVQLYDTIRLLMQGQSEAVAVVQIQQYLKGLDGKMLHFMENHDEMRIASKQFAGNAWLGVPGMVISATIDKGPVLIYFGQEVGEPALGIEGFGGDDGRTSIFDYWGVPEHQKWMNYGKFDGGGLSMEQKQLRDFYSELLRVSGSSSSIVKGEYVDLTQFNLKLGNISNRIVAYVRYSGDEKLLVVASFNSKTEAIKIALPIDLAARMGMNANSSHVGRDLLGSGLDVGFDSNFSCTFDILPFTGLIIKIK